VGWTCVVGLLYTFLLRPLLAWASGMIDIPVPPMLDMGDLFTLLAGMLGLGGMRTFEKLNGVQSTAVAAAPKAAPAAPARGGIQ